MDADHPGDTSKPPSKVYVLETCNASGTSDSSGRSPSADADNGLQSGTVTTVRQLAPGYTQTTKTSNGIRVTPQDVPGFGVITVTASPQAAGSITCGVSYAASVTPYAAGITCTRDVTYYAGDAHGRMPNDTSILTPRHGDTVSAFDMGTSGPPAHPDQYVCSPVFNAAAVGFAFPTYQWSGDGVTGSGSSAGATWVYSADDVQGWIPNGGPTKTVSLTITDASLPITATAVYNMRLHAPEETIIGTRGAMDLTTAYVDSPSVTIPYGGVPVTDSYEFSSKVSVTASLSGGANFSPAGLKWITANLGFSLSGSAEISYKRTVSVTWAAPTTPNTQRTWWFQRRGKYDHCTVDYDTYDNNGYAGHVTAQGVTFHSPDAATAAANDYNDTEMFQDAPM